MDALKGKRICIIILLITCIVECMTIIMINNKYERQQAMYENAVIMPTNDIYEFVDEVLAKNRNDINSVQIKHEANIEILKKAVEAYIQNENNANITGILEKDSQLFEKGYLQSTFVNPWVFIKDARATYKYFIEIDKAGEINILFKRNNN